jgi:hypothetical protein
MAAFAGSVIILVAAHPALAAAPTTAETDLSSRAGIAWTFRPENGDTKPIAVPAGGWRTQGYTRDAGTYNATIPIPRAAAGHAVHVVFDAVNFGADISAGADADHLTPVASHVDGWVPVTADVTKVAVPGQALLLQVDVKGRRKFMVAGKYTVPEGATWDPRVEEGILRGVHLQILPLIHLDNVFVKTQTAWGLQGRTGDSVNTVVEVENTSDQPATVRVEAKFSPAGSGRFAYPTVPAASVRLEPRQKTTVDLGALAWPAGAASYWWPNVPYRAGYRAALHNVDVTVFAQGKPTHTLRQRFGFRSFEAKGSHYYLNGIRCNLRGDNQQEADFDTDAYGIRPGFGPPTATNPGWPQAVDNLLHLNFNVMRIHQIPATSYMLDVCDERGLMLVDESPLRGSEGGEDYKNGRENMLRMDRELVRRDRNHPAVVIWSAANEWSEPIRDASATIRAEDPTRPIIADGVGDMGPDVINMQHYVSGFDVLPKTGGHPREDRPYGETEDIWPGDNTLHGFAWMATSVRSRRLLGDADLRNYVLNNAWPNYVPGETPENEILEKRVKRMDSAATILPLIDDPWHNANIRLLQQCYDPLAACDVEFDQVNARSNARGEWPVAKPAFAPGTRITRHIAVFNDEFRGEVVTLRYAFRRGDARGPVLKDGVVNLQIPCGEFRIVEVPFDVPAAPGDIAFVLTTGKDGGERFRESRMLFRVVAPGARLYPDGDYYLISALSGLPAKAGGPVVAGAPSLVQGAEGEKAVWRLRNVGDDALLTNAATGQVLTVADATGADGTAVVVRDFLASDASQLWHIGDTGDGDITLTNKKTGKLLDVYARATTPGTRLVAWAANDGANQVWHLSPAK